MRGTKKTNKIVILKCSFQSLEAFINAANIHETASYIPYVCTYVRVLYNIAMNNMADFFGRFLFSFAREMHAWSCWLTMDDGGGGHPHFFKMTQPLYYFNAHSFRFSVRFGFISTAAAVLSITAAIFFLLFFSYFSLAVFFSAILFLLHAKWVIIHLSNIFPHFTQQANT